MSLHRFECVLVEEDRLVCGYGGTLRLAPCISKAVDLQARRFEKGIKRELDYVCRKILCNDHVANRA